MILKNNWHIIILILLIFNITSFVAQNTEPSEKVLKHLTKEQKAMLAEQRVLIDKAKITFKNNLTIEQKKILQNKTLARNERSKLLKQSLSKKQRSLIDVNKRLLRNKRIKFKRSLTKKQVIRLRRFIKGRDVHDRKRLRRRLRRLIRDNLDSDN
jgi:hypothetical protein